MLHQAREELRRIPAVALRDIEHDLELRAEQVYKARSPQKSASKYKKLLKPAKLKSRKRLRSPSQLLPRIGDSRGRGSPLRGSPKFSPLGRGDSILAEVEQQDLQREHEEKDSEVAAAATERERKHCLDEQILKSAEGSLLRGLEEGSVAEVQEHLACSTDFQRLDHGLQQQQQQRLQQRRRRRQEEQDSSNGVRILAMSVKALEVPSDAEQAKAAAKWIRWTSILGAGNGPNAALLVQSGAVTNVLNICKVAAGLQSTKAEVVGANHLLVHGLNMLTAVLRALPSRLRPPLKSHFLRDVARVGVKALQQTMHSIKANERALPYHRGIEDFDAAPAVTGAALELILGMCAGHRKQGYGAIDLIAQTCHEFKWGARAKRASLVQR